MHPDAGTDAVPEAPDADETAAFEREWLKQEEAERAEHDPASDASRETLPEPDRAAETPPDGGGESEEEAEGDGDVSRADASRTDARDADDIPEHLRARFEELEQQAARAEQGRRSAEGRLRSMQQRMEPLGPEQNGSGTDTRQGSGTDDQNSLLESLKDIDGIVENYYDLEPMQKFAKAATEMIAQQNLKISQLENAYARISEGTLNDMSLSQEAILREAHPDYLEIAEGSGAEEFFGWLKGQGPNIRNIYVDNADRLMNAEEVGRLFTLYKLEKGIGTGPQTGQEHPAPRADEPKVTNLRKIQTRSARGMPRSTAPPEIRESDAPGSSSWEAEWMKQEAEDRRQLALSKG